MQGLFKGNLEFSFFSGDFERYVMGLGRKPQPMF
jgi:hypothetical protein